MLDTKQIDVIIQGTVKLIKSSKDYFQNKSEKIPQFTPTYRLSVEMAEEIKVHAVKGTFPDKLMARRAPNMDDKEFRYVRDNYQQVTLPVFVDYLNTIGRAFSDEMVISYGEKDEDREDTMKFYVETTLKDSPLKMPLVSWMRQIVPMYKSIDSMGCIVVKPHAIPTVEVEGEQLISSTDLFEPLPYYYPSNSLLSYQDGVYYLFELKDKSWVDFGGKKEKTGIIFELYDNENIYRIEQYGAKIDYLFRTVVYYNHAGTTIPVTRMRGFPFVEESSGELAWLSPFAYAVPVLNDVIADANQLRSVKAASVFPRIVELKNPCYNSMTMSNGEILCCNGTGHFYDVALQRDLTCSTCKGTGQNAASTPMGRTFIDPKDPLGSDTKVPYPAVYFVSPDPAIPKLTREEIEIGISHAREILHLKSKASLANSISEGSVNTTARGDMIDEKALTAFIMPIRDQIKDIYEFILEWIHFMRYGTEFEGSILMPSTIDIKTDADYLNEISEYIRLGMPSLVIQATIINFMRRKFSTQKDMAQALDLILKTDRIITMPFDQYSMELSKGLVEPWEVILHDSSITFIMELQVADPGFLNKDTEVQKQALIDKAKQKASEIKAATPTSPQALVSSVIDRARQLNVPAN